MNKNITDLGIILRRKPFSEADLLLTIFSQGHGKVNVLAKGSRKIKSKFMGHLEPFSLVKFSCVRGRSFWILTSARIEESFSKSKEASIKLFSYVAEVVDSLTSEEDNNKKIFDQVKSIYKNGQIEKGDSIINFLLNILEISGFAPSMTYCAKCGEKKDKFSDFSFYWGGVMCKFCSKDHKTHKVSSKSVKAIAEEAHFLPDGNYDDIKNLLKSFVEYINEKKINTSKFV